MIFQTIKLLQNMQGQDAITKLFQGMYASTLTASQVDCGTLIISLCHPCLFPCFADYIDYDTRHTIRLGVTYCNNIAALLIVAYAVYSVTCLFMTERASFASDPGQTVCSLDSSHDATVGVPPTNYKSDWQLYEEEMMEWFHSQGSSFIAFSDKDLARQRWLRVEEETIKWFHSRDKTLSLFSLNHHQAIQGLLARQRWLRIEKETIDWLNSRDRSLPLFSLNHHHTIQGLLAEQRRKEQERKEQEHKEQERKDQERREQRRKVQQRRERWRKEQERKEQERRELNRQFFEGAHKEMLKSIQDGTFPWAVKFNPDDPITPLMRQHNEEVLKQRKEIGAVADSESLSQALSHENVEEIAVVSTDEENEAITAVDEAEDDCRSVEEAELLASAQTVVTKELVRRSPRLAALPRVEYCATRKSVRRSARISKLARVDYKE